MDQTIAPFFLGFLTAGLVGLISSFIVKSWNTIERTQRQMFEGYPQPTLKALSTEKGVSGVGVVPNQSPLNVLSSGCLTILSQLFIQIGLFIAIGVILWWSATEELTASFFNGVFFALISGFLLQNIYYNYRRITTLYKLVTGPPKPQLNFASPPNQHYVAAGPASPSCAFVVNSLFEITWRLVLTFVLFGLLLLSISMVSGYLSEGVLGFLQTEEVNL